MRKKKEFIYPNFLAKECIFCVDKCMWNVEKFYGRSTTYECNTSLPTETQLSSIYNIVIDDDQFDKFKSLAVLCNKYNFKCLEQENFDGVMYIKFSTTLCNLSNFSMLLVYRKIIQIRHHFLYTLHT